MCSSDLEVSGFTQHEAGVDVELSDGRSMRAKYLVGCDGGRSIVRKHAGIDFTGWDASLSYLIAECAMTDEPAAAISSVTPTSAGSISPRYVPKNVTKNKRNM